MCRTVSILNSVDSPDKNSQTVWIDLYAALTLEQVHLSNGAARVKGTAILNKVSKYEPALNVYIYINNISVHMLQMLYDSNLVEIGSAMST